MALSMIVVAPARYNARTPCVIRKVARKGLGIQVVTWCDLTTGIQDGVMQVPAGHTLCAECARAIAAVSA